jgi:2-methylcitrate dehydratase
MSAKYQVTYEMAHWATELRYEDISPTAVHQAKRFLLDSLGCALGGFRLHGVTMALELLDELAAPGPATLIGSGRLVDVSSAAFANALMVRAMDYNDIYWKQDPSHPSDMISAAIAACERTGTGGKELLTAIIIGYELNMRFCEAGFPGVEERGWHHATLTAFISPLVAGSALRLNAEQIQNAIGISGCRHVTLGSVSAGELTMMKNTADPMATQSGMIAALLAEKGYTGPGHVLDGLEGFTHCIGAGWDFALLTKDLGTAWRIMDCGMKAFPTEALTHAPLSAVLDIIQSANLAAEQVKHVIIHTLTRAADILSDPSKYDPRTPETADHSLPYIIAVALVDHAVNPASFTEQKILDPTVRAQLQKVRVVGSREIDDAFPALQRSIVEVVTTGGQTLRSELNYPKGDPRNPLTDREIEDKFFSLVDGVLSKAQATQLKDAIWNVDSLNTVRELMLLTEAGPLHTSG